MKVLGPVVRLEKDGCGFMPWLNSHTATLFEAYVADKREVLSTQVQQEFYVTVTGKAALPSPVAARLVAEYTRLNVVAIEPHHILDAIDIHTRFRISFWDGLILAAAKSAGATLLYSEDFSHGQSYDGVEVRNPF